MIIPKIPNRKDATAALQAAFDESAATGDQVCLEGAYTVRDTLYLRGAKLAGTLVNFASNWTTSEGQAVGPTTIYARHAKDVFETSFNPDTGRQPVILGTAIVGFSLELGNPEAVSIISKAQGSGPKDGGTALVMERVLLDGPGIGIRLDYGSKQMHWSNIYIRSPRTGGILCDSRNYAISDGIFNNIYVNGKQRQPYGTATLTLPQTQYGIKGLPNAGLWMGRTLIEECASAIETGWLIDSYFHYLKIEALRTGICVNQPYIGDNLSSELHIDTLHMRAAFGPSCVPWVATTTGNVKPIVRVGSDSYTRYKAGNWAPDALKFRPGMLQFVK